MRIYLQLFRIELKKTIKGIPKQIGGAIVLLSFISTIAFCSVKLMSQKDSMTVIPIGLVVQEDSSMTEWAIDFAAGMDSVKGSMSFQRMETEQAYKDLENGKIQAILIFPDKMVESILNGTNIPAEVILKESNSISSLLLKEMISSGAKLLSSAQADIYTITDLYLNAGMEDKLQDTYQKLNIRNLRYALSRDLLFQRESLLATGNYSVVLYYFSTGVLLFLMLLGINCSHLLSKEPRAYITYLKIHKCSVFMRIIIKWASVFLSLLIFTAFLGGLCKVLASFTDYNLSFTIEGIFCGLTVLMCIASVIVCCYFCTKTAGGGIILLFVVTIAGVFLAGGFIPRGFFPLFLRNFSDYLPTTTLFQAILSILAQGDTMNFILPMLLSSLFFITTATCIESLIQRRRVNHDE